MRFNGGFSSVFRKQSFTDDLQIRCSQKVFNIHRKTPVLEYEA